MHYYRVRDRLASVHLAVRQEDELVSLTSINDAAKDFRSLLRASDLSGVDVDDIARHILSTGGGERFDFDALVEQSRTSSSEGRLLSPLVPDEMLAGGIGNYPMTSEAVNALPEATRRAYESERPPIMYKGSATRLVGPFDNIGVRADIEQTFAEGELVLVIYKGRLVAYSTGNEVAGGLMSESLWWMLPSKVFKGCASLGPCLVTPESLPSPTDLKMDVVVTRNGKEAGRATNTTALRRHAEDIVHWAMAHDSPPELVIIYSGGCAAVIDAPLQAGDVARISLEGIGFVENTVEIV